MSGSQRKIPVFCDRNPGLHRFVLSLTLLAGPLYETEGEEGSSHFFEHLVFRNINRRMNGTLYRTLDRLGLTFSACTYREMIRFSISGIPAHFCEAAEIFTQILSPLSLSSQDLQLERKRVKAEIAEADERSSLDHFAAQKIWAGTPLQRLITGSCAAVDRLGVRRMQEIAETILREGMPFFSVTGAVSEEHLAALSAYAARFPVRPGSGVRRNLAPVPQQFFHRKPAVYCKSAGYCEVCLSFDFDARRYSHAQRDLLYALLFSGESSRFYEVLSEETGLLYDYDALIEAYRNIGVLSLSFSVRPASLLAVLEKTVEVLSTAKQPDPEGFLSAQGQYTETMDMLLDDPEDLSFTLDYERGVLGAGYASLAQRKETYRAVRAEDVAAFAEELFRPQNLTVCVKGRKDRLPLSKISGVLQGLAAPSILQRISNPMRRNKWVTGTKADVKKL